MTAPHKRIWAKEELAGYLGVTVGWIYNRTRKNGPDRIPHFKMGKYLRFAPDSDQFVSWLEGKFRQ